MRLQTSVSVLALAASVAGAGCYPDRLDTTNYDVVATVYDTSATFNKPTFAMSDSIVHLVPPGGNDNISRAFDAQIIARVRQNMTARGYVEVANPTTADFDILLAASTTEYQGYYWGYWCDYWGYWYPYGCYYPPYWGTYSYTVGSLFVAMTEPSTASAGKVGMVWLNVANGLAGTGATASRLTAAVDQMFTQSPYVTAQ